MSDYNQAVSAIKQAILDAQYQAARGANAVQLSLYFGIGKYVSENSRNGFWGKGTIESISSELQAELPGLRGFSATNIRNMRMFYEAWPDVASAGNAFCNSSAMADELTSSVSPKNKLPATASEIDMGLISRRTHNDDGEGMDWDAFLAIGFTHHMEIIAKTKDTAARLYYIQETSRNGWDKYTLRNMLKADAYGHQGALANNFAQTMPEPARARRTVNLFKDEYLLDFINVEELDVRDVSDIDERIVEHEIVCNIRSFIMRLGSSFCFIGNQHRLMVGNEEFFVDLLFYNRELSCLVAIELKRGKFKPAYLGQLGFYLSALDESERRPGEEPPVGLLLCQDADKAVVELAVRDYANPMGVATYRMPAAVPDHYKSLRPVMEKAQELLEESLDIEGGE